MVQPGQLQVLVARDARAEQCDIMGGNGSDPTVQRVEFRIDRVATPAEGDRMAQFFNHPAILAVAPPAIVASPIGQSPPQAVGFDVLSGQATILASKPAERGNGRVLRLLLLDDQPVVLQPRQHAAALPFVFVDLAERDLAQPAAPILKNGVFSVARKTHGAIVGIRYGID
ncbi:MAG: hypothetical protein EXR77_07365 [Myxococcales bacterium]|nr:hypothetical protein [Myxococcales bacterium]